MENQLQKAINIARKTGDRLIVFDSSRADSVFVVMSLAEYEKLVIDKKGVRNLTENEMLDKINRDIATWKNEQITKEQQRLRPDRDFFVDSGREHHNGAGINYANKFGDEPDYLSVVSDFFTDQEEKSAENKGKSKRHWQIPKDRKEAAEEVIEEDRQYLEEIRY